MTAIATAKTSTIAGWFATVSAAILAVPAAAHAATADRVPPATIRMSIDEDPIVPHLAESLGYFAEEGLTIVRVKVEDFSGNDYELQKPLRDGKIDVAYHWFAHAAFGARHDLPIKALMMFNDAPGISIFVADQARVRIRSAADFRGVRVAEGAGYATKSLLTHYLARQAGLPVRSYHSVMTGTAGRQEAILAGLAEGTVDIVAAQEPISSAVRTSGRAKLLYDLNSGPPTSAVLGATWPAQALLTSPMYMARHPDRVQRLVNAFVRTMRLINSHSAEEVAAALPAAYFAGKDRAREIELIRSTLPSFARGNYAVPADGAALVTATIEDFPFDTSPTGRWRAGGSNRRIRARDLYDNSFVARAMQKWR